MAHYAIGDLQGCLDQLIQLLDKLNFDPAQDKLWFVGDLINRGPKSLETLRYVKNLGDTAITVLGNHDISLLAIDLKVHHIKKTDTFQEILQAEDKAELINWLRQQPLVHLDKELGYIMAHAGIYPNWSLDEILSYAKEAEQELQKDSYPSMIKHIYTINQTEWRHDLSKWPRISFIANTFTRMRFCSPDYKLEIKTKDNFHPDKQYKPWFSLPNKIGDNLTILFGHWAALNGVIPNSINAVALDTGCVWGKQLTAIRLEDKRLFQVSCKV